MHWQQLLRGLLKPQALRHAPVTWKVLRTLLYARHHICWWSSRPSENMLDWSTRSNAFRLELRSLEHIAQHLSQLPNPRRERLLRVQQHLHRQATARLAECMAALRLLAPHITITLD
jgi:hypothetical protein